MISMQWTQTKSDYTSGQVEVGAGADEELDPSLEVDSDNFLIQNLVL